MANQDPTALPDGYFERLSSRVFEKIASETEADELPAFLKNKALKKSPFALPEGYFERLSSRVFEKIASGTEADELPAFLKNEALKKSPFALPEGYFERLSSRVFEKANEREKGKIRPLFLPVFNARAAMAMAASAALAVAAALFFKQRSAHPVSPIAAEMAACSTAKCFSDRLSEADCRDFVLENLDEFEAEQLADEDVLAQFSSKKPLQKKSEAIELDVEDAKLLLNELDAEDLEDLL